MSRLDFEHMLPEDSFFSEPVERDPDEEMPRKRWKAEDVQVYRQALCKLGFSGDVLEDQISKDCGKEFDERPMLSRPQAGGVR